MRRAAGPRRRATNVARARSWRAVALSAGSAIVGLGLATALWHVAPPMWRSLKAHPYFRVHTVDVGGNLRLSREEILQSAGVTEGMSIWDAVPHTLRWQIERNSWIERASVKREFPNRLAIRVRERRPLAIARLDGLHYVDRHGRLLGPLRDEDSRDFVIITGLGDEDARGFADVGLHRAARLLRLCERVDCFDALSEVHVAPRRGVTVYPTKPHVAITLGWGGWREKLIRSARVFSLWAGQADRLETVDVSFRDQVVVRLRADDRPAPTRPRKRGVRI